MGLALSQEVFSLVCSTNRAPLLLHQFSQVTRTIWQGPFTSGQVPRQNRVQSSQAILHLSLQTHMSQREGEMISSGNQQQV